jgi:ElaB/YqjD/DUF883 family membrane-anchored ribosome-binding protein
MNTTSPTVADTKSVLSEVAQSAQPLIKRASEQASALAHQGIDTWNATSQQLRDKAQQASDGTVSYIRDKPLTSVLIAAAGGAALMAIAAVLARPRYRD